MTEEVIQAKHISYEYGGDAKALDDVSISIRRGEKVAVMGANGAGKSTFFLNLNGVLAPHRGEIWYEGTRIGKKNREELPRHVGFVFQDADSQIIASTVQAEVSFGPMNMRLPKQEVQERMEEALDYMDLEKYRERPPHYLSGGEKKRVTIADIIAMKPEVVLFDEPSASLDPLSVDMLEEVLEKLSKDGKTLLISTHDVDFAYRWAQRILVFCGGTVIADGTPLEIFQNDAVLSEAHLKKPVMLKIYETLNAGGRIEPGSYPRRPEELPEVMK